MTLDIRSCPIPVKYREIWLPRSINGDATLPSARYNGRELTLTGAKLGTTADGVHIDGTANSNIDCGAIHNAAAKLWVSFRFKLDQAYAAGAANFNWLWSKRIDANSFLYFYLDTATGKLAFTHEEATVIKFSIISAQATWAAGTFYHVLASISSVNGARLRIDNSVAVTDADTTAAPNGGNIVIGHYANPGDAVSGHKGVISDVFMGTDDLTAAEETDLYNGIPPADAVHAYLLDEGRGVTSYDRGSGANNGTLGSACTWAFGQVRQPVLSLDGINDYEASSAGIDISGNLTCVWVAKMKSTYNALISGKSIFRYRIDGNNEIYAFYDNTPDRIQFNANGGGSSVSLNDSDKPAIDAYRIYLFTVSSSGIVLYRQGTIFSSSVAPGARPAGGATGYLGRLHVAANYDISKPLFAALIDGAMTAKQALAYSRWLRDSFNLPISM